MVEFPCYFDASALVKRYVNEAGSAAVQDLFEKSPALLTASLAYAEIYSAFFKAYRMGDLSRRDLENVSRWFEEDWQLLEIIDFRDDVRKKVPELIRHFPLRGSDSVHLASAATLKDRGLDFLFVVSDRKLLNAASDFGLKVLDPASRT